MKCSPYELKDYFFGELGPAEREAVEAHVASCGHCRDELGALNATRAALLSVPEEEPPRRIAFVSDKVFEPRWWQRLWASGPRLGFAAAAMLAVAIVIHGFAAPRQAPPVVPLAVAPASVNEAELARRVQAEVAKAVAASQEEQMAKTLSLVNARLRDAKMENREQLLMIRDYLERMDKRNSVMLSRAAYE
jgi:anti-sigma factor RsiW